MEIKVGNTELDVWEDGWPYWFHIKQGDNIISFTEQSAPAIRDALNNLVEHTMRKVRAEDARRNREGGPQ